MLSEFAAGKTSRSHKSEVCSKLTVHHVILVNIASVRKIKPISVMSEDVAVQKERHMQV